MTVPGHEGTPAILVMAKPPWPGTVETGLHPLLGPLRCAGPQAELVGHTVEPATAHTPRTHRGLAETRTLARRERLSVGLPDPLRDLDTPEDTAAFWPAPALSAGIATLLQPVAP